jgi:hypothetical protein
MQLCHNHVSRARSLFFLFIFPSPIFCYVSPPPHIHIRTYTRACNARRLSAQKAQQQQREMISFMVAENSSSNPLVSRSSSPLSHLKTRSTLSTRGLYLPPPLFLLSRITIAFILVVAATRRP